MIEEIVEIEKQKVYKVVGEGEVMWDRYDNGTIPFPCWIYLKHEYAGDSPDYTTLIGPEKIKESMRETLDAFSHMSVIEKA